MNKPLSYPKSLEEVWDWKAKVREEREKADDLIAFYKEGSKEIVEKLSLKIYKDKNVD